MGFAEHHIDPLREVDLQRLQMLVVAADEVDLIWLEELINKRVPYESVSIEHAASCDQALSMLEYGQYHLCFFDAALGESAALKFLRNLRAWGNPFPVIVLAAEEPAMEEATVKALQAGATDYLIKQRTGTNLLLRSIRYCIEQHRSEITLKRWQRRFRYLFDRSLAGVYRLSMDGRVLECNQALARILGYRSREEIIGKNLQELHTPLTSKRALLQRALDPRGLVARELCLQRRDGKPVWVMMSDSLVEGDDETPPTFEGTLVDISELKDTEEALHGWEAKYLALFDAVAEGVVVLDSSGRIKACNSRLEQILGLPISELLGRSFESCVRGLVGEDGLPIAKESCPPFVTLRSSEPVSGKVVGFDRVDGRRVWVSIRSTPVLAPSGSQSRSVIASLTDVTDTRELEEHVQLVQKMEILGRLAGGVAHDFRNLLTAILGYAELLLRKLQHGDPIHTSASEIHRAAKRAIDLSGQLLSFTRREVQATQILDLNQQVRNLESMLRGLGGSQVKVFLQLDPSCLAVRADPGRLEQVIMNLAVNARDAMPEGGTLVLKTSSVIVGPRVDGEEPPVQPGNYVKLAVADTGMGMDEATRSRIFEPFFTTKEPGKGTGLGLATVFDIVRSSGGGIAVHSAPEQGTTIEVFLPEAEAATEESA